MDLFKYNNLTTMQSGEAIEGYTSATWVERYRDPGEFEINAPLSSGLRNLLPLGTVISNVASMELMIVENHQVTEEEDESAQLSITGRSFETFLENRIVGQNYPWATAPPSGLDISQYVLPAEETWFQAVKLINDHIATGVVVNASDAIPFIVADTVITGTGVVEERIIKRGEVHKALVDLLEINDLGVRISRTHTFDHPFPGPYSVIEIYGGVDRRETVVFSAQTGDISTADYLWSMKKLKNAALVSGKFVESMVYGPETGYNRRVMLVDGGDIDGHYTEVPVGAELLSIRQAMEVRGRQALSAQKEIVLSGSDISNSPSYQYRKDYNVGDAVSIDGSFGETVLMRVVEYAEIDDVEESTGQPTLALLEE